jgi:hypothetical protein
MNAAKGAILPADHPLAGCHAKFWRAHENFDSLQSEIVSEFSSGETQLITTRGEFKPTPEDQGAFIYVIYVDEVFQPSLRYAVIIGDIVHELRSALDHLVFELAFLGLNGKSFPMRVAYPVSRDRANWSGKYVQGTLLKGVMQKHRAMIYRTQPCSGKQDAASPRAIARRKRHPLSDLDNLWNHDKHRMIQPVGVAAMRTDCRIVSHPDCEVIGTPTLNRGFFGKRFEVDTEIVAIPVRATGANPQVNVQFEGEGEICFRNGLPARESLAKIGDWVKSVLTWFQPEFETPRAKRLWDLPRGDWIDTSPFRRVKGVWVTGDNPADKPPGFP